MVLLPLEFSECFLDSPWFRGNIQQYEEELERTNSQIKHLIKDAKNMLNACKTQGKMMSGFNERLQKFQFDFGENLTDDEKGIAGSLKEFGLMLEEVSTEWLRTVERSQMQLIEPLEKFRKDHIYGYRESKKAFEKASERYYKQLEHTLGLSHKKKEQLLQESDNELVAHKKNFHKVALKYVYKLQEVQERKKFEFVEHLLMFMQVYFNYFRQMHETASDCKDYLKDLQMRLVATRQRYVDATDKTQALMRKMADQTDSVENTSQSSAEERWSRAGYLFLMEKNPISAMLASKWSRQFCLYSKEKKMFQMITPYSPSTSISVGNNLSLNLPPITSAGSGFQEQMLVKKCTRRISDSIDKRFCFDLELQDISTSKLFTVTMQAVSDVDRKRWMAVMDGKEPAYIVSKVLSSKEGLCKLDETGFEFAKLLIEEIENRGVHHEGIYRLVGVMSKVDMLLHKALNQPTEVNLDISNTDAWETNTLTSALKSYLRNLPEPLMTFDLHRDFIDAAKCEFLDERVSRVAKLVKNLPAKNQKVLSMLAEHLEKVQEKNEQNKMTVQNIGVCFGPTLMRDRQETVQAIMEIKFSNIIVEIMIENRQLIFGDFDPDLVKEHHNGSEDQNSPKVFTKTVSHISRLPSQRLKQRPRGIVSEAAASIPEVKEESNSPKESPDNEVSTRFRRSRAFRDVQRISPKTKRLLDKASAQASVSSSDEEDDGYGHMSPLDLNFDISELTTPSDASPSSAFVNAAPSEKTTPEVVTTTVVEKPSDVKMISESESSNVSITSTEKASSEGNDTDHEEPNGTLKAFPTTDRKSENKSPPPVSEANPDDQIESGVTAPVVKTGTSYRLSGPQPKKRVSSLIRRKPVTSDTIEHGKHNKNASNNNNSHIYLEKSRNLAIAATASFIHKKNKFMASVKEGLASPSVPIRSARKVFSGGENRLKAPRRSDSSASDLDIPTPVPRKQRSTVVPATFEQDDTSDDDDNNNNKEDKTTFSAQTQMFLGEIEVSNQNRPENDLSESAPTSPASSIASPSSQTTANKSIDQDSDQSDDEFVTTNVRTLYACKAEQENELSFEPGQVISDVKQSKERGWLHGNLNGRAGLVPKNYVEFV